MKHRLWDMSWMEAEEAFSKCDTVILPVGTLHGHGPTPISIDCSSVEWLAEEVGKRTGLVTLPLLPYGEDDKQKFYPGSITIDPVTLERFYVDVFRSLRRNGVRRVIVLNGHGGNREVLIRAGRAARDFGVIIAIPEWWSLGRQLTPELFPEKGSYMAELAVSLALQGKEIADLRGTGYKGEWGERYTMRNILGDEIEPLGFNSFEYKGGRITIPVQAWDLDVEGPPVLGEEVVDELYERGKKILDGLVPYLVDFALHFKDVDLTEALKSRD
ncbi:MAG: creatininase family protein [Candidatus Bathyarchaeota archaeon]|nr:creatininase family protein [Candidatus Bathyarchaeota archaeon]